MKPGMTNIFVWTLMLITIVSGLNLTQVTGISTPAAIGTVMAPASPEMSVPVGNGTMHYHLATDADIQRMKELLLVNGNGSSLGNSFSNSSHVTGLSVPTGDQLDKLVGQIAIFDSFVNSSVGSSPTSYDISTQPYFPEVRDQGSEGACGAFSTIYYNFGYLTALDNGWTDASLGNNEHLLSPSWVFNKAVLTVKDAQGHETQASNIEDNALMGKTIGVSTWSDMPYLQTNYLDWGSETAWRDAPSHRIDNIVYYPYGTTTIQDIKDSLVSNHPVTIALNSASINGDQTAFADGNHIISASEYAIYSNSTDHAATIVGYDDTMTDGIHPDVGAFKLVNSWGTSFGSGGYFWMSYDTINEIGPLLQAISLTDKVDYQPFSLAVYHFDEMGPEYDAPITFSAVRVSDGQVMAAITPHFSANSQANMPTFMCQDISELSIYLMDPRYSIEMTVNSPAWGGKVSSFRLELCSDPYVVGKAAAIGPQGSLVPFSAPPTFVAQLPAVPTISPADALSYHDGALTFAGQAQWVGVRNVPGSPQAMQSGDVGDNDISTLIDVVQGPGTLSFDWKVSSEASSDLLSFILDGNVTAQISGETSWTPVVVRVPTGTHYLNWTYSKDHYLSSGDDCGWIDNVLWTGSSTVLFDDFEPNGTNSWYGGDSNAASGSDYWGSSTLRAATGTHSLWCAENGIGENGVPNHMNRFYDPNMDVSVYVALPDLTGMGNGRLSFQYWADTSLTDHAYVQIFDGSAWTTIWTQPAPDSGGWRQAEMAVPTGAQELALCFSSGSATANGHAGVFIDDVLVTVSDTQPPSSWLSPLPAYTSTQTVALNYNASDTGGSGIANVQVFFRKGASGSFSAYVPDPNLSGTWTSGTINVNLSALGKGEGAYQFYSVATDRTGNTETAPASADTSTIWDRTAPTTTASSTGNDAPARNLGPVSITLTAKDVGGSGISTTSYRVDSGSWTAYSNPIIVSSQGVHSIQFFSVDKAGNVESTKTMAVNLDGQSPVIVVTMNGVAGNAQWYRGNVNVTITASGQVNGVQKTVYSLDSSATIGAWTNYSGALLVTSEGNHTLEYRSTDMAGNAGPINYVNFTIDRVAPVTDLNASGKQGMNEWYVGTVTLNITAADGSSGIRATHYRLDEGDWAISGRDIIISADGNHTLEYYSVDNAGNTENVRSISLKIDTEMPAANFSIDNGTTVDNRSLSVGVTTNDSGSGIALTTYKLDDQVYAPLTGGQINLTGLSEGQHTISLQVMDQAGHSEFKELTFTVDNVTKDVNISSTTTSSDPGPLVILLLVGSAVVAIAAVVGVRLWKRSKR